MKLPAWLLLFPVLLFGAKPVLGELIEPVAMRAPSVEDAGNGCPPPALPVATRRTPKVFRQSESPLD